MLLVTSFIGIRFFLAARDPHVLIATSFVCTILVCLQVVRTFVSRLIQLKVVYTRDETTLTKFALLRARDAFK